MAMDPTQRRGARARLLPVLRRQPVRQADRRRSSYDALNSEEQRRAAVQPRDRRRLSDRLDVQADHRDGRAASRASSRPSTTIVDAGAFKLGAADVPERRRRRLRRAQPRRRRSRSPPTSSSTRSARARRLAAARSSSTGRSRLGLGHRTGIDLPGEFAGLVPDRQLARRGLRQVPEVRQAREGARPADARRRCTKCGGIERPWSTGDNVNLAVGQGDLQATPLQLADAYAAIANGGTVVRPHLGDERRGRRRAR